MRKKVLSCLVAAGFIMSVSAVMGQGTTNTTQNTPPSRRDEIGSRLEKMSKALSLTDEQKAKIKDIMTSSREKVMKIHADAKAKLSGAGSDTNAVAAVKADAQTQVKKLHADENEQIKAVLTPDQLLKFKEMHQAQRGKAQPVE